MDWQFNLLLLMAFIMPYAYSWSPISSTQRRSFYEPQLQQQQQPQKILQQPQQHLQQPQQQSRNYQQQKNAVLPYLDLITCPLRLQPWSCARQQSARLLDIWDDELHVQWQKLKVEADRQLNSTLEKRGYSDTTTLSKVKPSTILKKIEIGSDFMKEYLAETMDGFLGREYEYMQPNNENNFAINEQQHEAEADEYDEDEDEDEEAVEESVNPQNIENVNEQTSSNSMANESNNSELEFVELEDDVDDADNSDDDDAGGDDTIDALKKPGGSNKKRKKKKKKGSQHDAATHAANLLVIQPLEQQLAHQQQSLDQFEPHGANQLLKPFGHKIKPLKQKKRKRKKGGGHGGITNSFVEQEPATDSLALGLLEELSELGGDVGGKRKKKHPMNYGRSNGVVRSKKKKKKKALMKLMLLGSFLKAKIELLLKLLGAHLQIKFFAIALIGLLINVARFWIDIKRGGTPQKVVYVEHAHHQHHYDNNSEDWSESAGGYWKRSLQTDSTENAYDSVTDSYQPRQPHHLQLQQEQMQQQYDPQYLAYRNQWQRK